MNEKNRQSVQELFEGLRLNLKLSQDILHILKEEGVALQSMDTQGLLRLSKQKSNALAKIQYLDESIKKTITKITADKQSTLSGNQGDKTNPQLSGLNHLLSAEDIKVVERYKLELNKLRQDILTRNIINKRFTEDTLGYIGDAISLMTSSAREENTYSAYNPPPTFQQPSLISREV